MIAVGFVAINGVNGATKMVLQTLFDEPSRCELVSIVTFC